MKIICLFMILFAASCTSGGLGNLESVVVRKAAFDFNCPEQSISTLPEGITTFAARGCGRTATYEVKCSLGPCVAKEIK